MYVLTSVIDLVQGTDLAIQTSEALWEELRAAGEAEYDRFWRLPLDEDFGPQIHSSNADLCNVTLNPSSIQCSMSFLIQGTL